MKTLLLIVLANLTSMLWAGDQEVGIEKLYLERAKEVALQNGIPRKIHYFWKESDDAFIQRVRNTMWNRLYGEGPPGVKRVKICGVITKTLLGVGCALAVASVCSAAVAYPGACPGESVPINPQHCCANNINSDHNIPGSGSCFFPVNGGELSMAHVYQQHDNERLQYIQDRLGNLTQPIPFNEENPGLTFIPIGLAAGAVLAFSSILCVDEGITQLEPGWEQREADFEKGVDKKVAELMEPTEEIRQMFKREPIRSEPVLTHSDSTDRSGKVTPTAPRKSEFADVALEESDEALPPPGYSV